MIVTRPGKLSGAPHIEGTRITVGAIKALYRHGFTVKQIAEMYEIDPRQVISALAWEDTDAS